MLKAKIKDDISFAIPANIVKQLKLKEGDTIEAEVKKGKLVVLGKKDKFSAMMRYAGIWQDEKVDKVFDDIRKGWSKWQNNLSA